MAPPSLPRLALSDFHLLPWSFFWLTQSLAIYGDSLFSCHPLLPCGRISRSQLNGECHRAAVFSHVYRKGSKWTELVPRLPQEATASAFGLLLRQTHKSQSISSCALSRASLSWFEAQLPWGFWCIKLWCSWILRRNWYLAFNTRPLVARDSILSSFRCHHSSQEQLKCSLLHLVALYFSRSFQLSY